MNPTLRISAERLTKIMNAVYVLRDECKLRFDEKFTGTITSTDTAHIAQTVITIDRSAWIEVDVPIGSEFDLDVDKVLNFLKYVKPAEPVKLEFLGDCVSLMTVDMEYAFHSPKDVSDPEVVNLTLKSHMEVSAPELRNALTFLQVISDHVEVKMTRETLGIMAHYEEPEENDSASVSLKSTAQSQVVCEEPMRSMYPLDYLINLVKNAPHAIVIYLGNNQPMDMYYWMDDAIKVRAMLAPRVERE